MTLCVNLSELPLGSTPVQRPQIRRASYSLLGLYWWPVKGWYGPIHLSQDQKAHSPGWLWACGVGGM